MTPAPHRATPRPIYVNGRFLGRPVTGVERFAGGVLRALDRQLSPELAAQWTVLVPSGVSTDQGLTQIKIREIGRRGGHLWEQIELARASRDGVLVNLCNSGPILHPRELVVIHDALVYRFPQGFSRPYRLLHQTLGRLLARRAQLATVSDFSRQELAAIFRIPPAAIGVIPNAVDHLESVEADGSVVERLDLAARPFFLFVGSPAPNKNLKTALEGFKAAELKDARFVMVGAAAKVFAAMPGFSLPDNCLFTGRLSDGEIKALYGAATALVFPSLYEGFGIPPLEAMSLGCPVIAADIPVLREVCGTDVDYFDPHDAAAIAAAMRVALAAGSSDTAVLQARLDAARIKAKSYTWQNSAKKLLTLLDAMTPAN